MLMLFKKYFSLLALSLLFCSISSCSFFRGEVEENSEEVEEIFENEESENSEEVEEILENEESENSDLMFNIDETTDFYGIDVLVLKINFEKDTRGRVIGILPEGETESSPEVKDTENPEYYLNLPVNYQRKTNYQEVNLYSQHKTEIQSLLNEIPADYSGIILMYVNGSNLKNYSDTEGHVERTVYTQMLTNFLYDTANKIVVEKRYHESIPEDEIFMIASIYEGKIPINVYNSAKGNILEWLSRYNNLEKSIIDEVNRIKKQIENSVNNITKGKDETQLSKRIEIERESQIDSGFNIEQEDIYRIYQERMDKREEVVKRRRGRSQLADNTNSSDEKIEARHDDFLEFDREISLEGDFLPQEESLSQNGTSAVDDVNMGEEFSENTDTQLSEIMNFEDSEEN